MKNLLIITVLVVATVACSNEKHTSQRIMLKQSQDLPTVGILVFEGFLANEVVAPLDVFTKADSNGNKLFHTLLVARTSNPYTSEEGLRVIPDITITECPQLDVLIVPSSFSPAAQVADSSLIEFIRLQDRSAAFIASHCAGAFLVGQAGIASNRKLVTYEGGSESLQAEYPDLLVQDDHQVSYIRDGKFISSNGSLVSYPASLALLEELTSPAHRQHVEKELLYHKLK